jgi:hypothetical protein
MPGVFHFCDLLKQDAEKLSVVIPDAAQAAIRNPEIENNQCGWIPGSLLRSAPE